MRNVIIIALTMASAIAYGDTPDTQFPSAEAKRIADEANAAYKQAAKDKDPKKLERAHTLYQQYLAKYPDVREGTLSFYDAELLFSQQRYDEAAKMYERVTALAPHGIHGRDAAYAYVIATKNAVEAADRSAPDMGAPCPDARPCALTPAMQRMVGAFDRYLALVDKSDERPNMEYRRARIYYEFNHFAEAAPLFDAIVTHYPKNELATYSANLEMDCLAILKRYNDLRALVARVKKSPTLMSDATVQQQVKLLEEGLKKKP